MTIDEYIAEAVDRRCFWCARSHSVVERESKGLRKVSSTIGDGDTEPRVPRDGARRKDDGTRPSFDDRSTGS